MECPCCLKESVDENQTSRWQLESIHNHEFTPLAYHSLLPPLIAEGVSMGVVVTNKNETCIKPVLLVTMGIVKACNAALDQIRWQPLCDERAGFNQLGMTGFEWLEMVRGYQYGGGQSQPPFAYEGTARKAIEIVHQDDPITSDITMTVDESTLLLTQDFKKMKWDGTTEDNIVDQLVRCGFYLDQHKGYCMRYLVLLDKADLNDYIDQLKQYRYGPLVAKMFTTTK